MNVRIPHESFLVRSHPSPPHVLLVADVFAIMVGFDAALADTWKGEHEEDLVITDKDVHTLVSRAPVPRLQREHVAAWKKTHWKRKPWVRHGPFATRMESLFVPSLLKRDLLTYLRAELNLPNVRVMYSKAHTFEEGHFVPLHQDDQRGKGGLRCVFAYTLGRTRTGAYRIRKQRAETGARRRLPHGFVHDTSRRRAQRVTEDDEQAHEVEMANASVYYQTVLGRGIYGRDFAMLHGVRAATGRTLVVILDLDIPGKQQKEVLRNLHRRADGDGAVAAPSCANALEHPGLAWSSDVDGKASAEASGKGKASKQGKRHTMEQVQMLKAAYKANPYPKPVEITALSVSTRLTVEQVIRWMKRERFTTKKRRGGGGGEGEPPRARRFTMEQVQMLKAAYNKANQYPKGAQITALSVSTGLTVEQVKKWMKQKRYRTKKRLGAAS